MIRKASRHRGIKASRGGFSLIEVLLAVFILGIGIISIASLFPAGIMQQQQSYDDIMGPLVADNAMSVLRSKLRQEDFGAFEDPLFNVDSPRPTIVGDWPWLRPSVVLADDTTTNLVDEAGALDIFSAVFINGGSAAVATEFPNGYQDPFGNTASPFELVGIPYVLVQNRPPRVIISRTERYYPMPTAADLNPDGTSKATYRPQFYWECMFRRFQGRVQVAVFVFRIAGPGGRPTLVRLPDGRTVPYAAPPNPANNERCMLPIRLPLAASGGGGNALLDLEYTSNNVFGNPDAAWDANGPDNDWTNTSIILGSPNGNNYNPFELTESWQEPRQRIVDQNGNLHRVLSRFHSDDEFGGAMQVELVRPVPASRPILPPYFVLAPTNAGNEGIENVVSDIWYLPRYIRLDTNGDARITALDEEFSLTPVFVSISDL